MHTKNKVVRLSRQQGMSLWSVALNIFILGSFLVLALRVAPSYMTYLTVKDIVERAAEQYDPKSQSLADIRTRIRKLLNTSRVYDIKAEDIDVFRDNGKVIIDATYEVRFPLVWIIDGVMVFDDLLIEMPGH